MTDYKLLVLEGAIISNVFMSNCKDSIKIGNDSKFTLLLTIAHGNCEIPILFLFTSINCIYIENFLNTIIHILNTRIIGKIPQIKITKFRLNFIGHL